MAYGSSLHQLIDRSLKEEGKSREKCHRRTVVFIIKLLQKVHKALY